MLAVREQQQRLGDAMVAVVTFADPQRLAGYRAHLQLPFAVLSDTHLELYRLLGAGRATRRRVWSIGTLRLYARLLRRGRRMQRPTEDVRQLGADAVIAPDGTLRWLARPSAPHRRPSIDELVAALRP